MSIHLVPYQQRRGESGFGMFDTRYSLTSQLPMGHERRGSVLYTVQDDQRELGRAVVYTHPHPRATGYSRAGVEEMCELAHIEILLPGRGTGRVVLDRVRERHGPFFAMAYPESGIGTSTGFNAAGFFATCGLEEYVHARGPGPDQAIMYVSR